MTIVANTLKKNLSVYPAASLWACGTVRSKPDTVHTSVSEASIAIEKDSCRNMQQQVIAHLVDWGRESSVVL